MRRVRPFIVHDQTNNGLHTYEHQQLNHPIEKARKKIAFILLNAISSQWSY
jgi:hypothetical protein